MDSRKAVYETVSLNDDHEESLSSTEVDESLHESLMGEEKQWRSEGQPRRRPGVVGACIDVFKSCRWFIDTILFLLIVALLLSLHARERGLPPNTLQIGGDYTGGGPEFTTKITKWDADMRFIPQNATEFFSSDTLAVWNSIMPAGTGRALTNNTFFTTSMTHSLHCIYMMARIFHGITSNNYGAIPSDYHHHFLHCVDYLRQSTMCSADLAMEAHDEKDSDDFGPLDGGWNSHHVCKDYSQVTSYLEGQIKDGVRVILPIDD